MTDSGSSSFSGSASLLRQDSLSDCPVCYTKIQYKTVVFPCEHTFCLECIMQWDLRDDQAKTTCPMCRTELVEARHSFDRNGGYISTPLNLTAAQRQALENSPRLFQGLYNSRVSSGPNPYLRQWSWTQHVHGTFFVMSEVSPVNIGHTQDTRIIQNKLQSETHSTIIHRRVVDKSFTNIGRINREYGFASDLTNLFLFEDAERYARPQLRDVSARVSNPAFPRLRPSSTWSAWMRPENPKELATRIRTTMRIDKTAGYAEDELPKTIQVTEIKDLEERRLPETIDGAAEWDLGPEIEPVQFPRVRAEIRELLRQIRQSIIRQRVALGGLPNGMTVDFDRTLSNIHLPF
ncbi:RING/U-box [Glarea lozoyensis ATCC 20868]|uniref:RING/U-box n=1 Tax=Glarea lozoyensis (strain ATCC 20868 / MF5171) TaxID=1116229 RepID=S3CWD9_GLAL2|nr:RING/U-box [Glarea lozoyensis ATCC 20868]EPE29955.1 RING/U-box [Glarea lozoyensis ATCC 20868]